MKKILKSLIIISIILISLCCSIASSNDFSSFPSDGHRILGTKANYDIIVPDDYQTIQEAIDAVSPHKGYHIFVRNGTYSEHLIIPKDGIILTGENKEHTIINAEKQGPVIYLIANYINISGFTLRNCGLEDSAVCLDESSGNRIENNIFIDNAQAMRLIRSHGNLIQHNVFINNHKGCVLDFCLIGNTIQKNLFLDNNIGVFVNQTCRSNMFYLNTFKNNDQHAYSLTSVDGTLWNNETQGNYWDDYQGEDRNGDGIGDTSYPIAPLENIDYYPQINPTVNLIKPTISIIKPASNMLYVFNKPIMTFPMTCVIGSITILFNVWDNDSAIDTVEIFIDGKLQDTLSMESYTFMWDEPAMGKRIITIKASDDENNQSTKKISLFKFG